jgi:hypothetical protein
VKAPILLNVCKACGRDMSGAECSFCDVEVAAPVPLPPGPRAFRCVQRHEGLGMYEIAEILGDTSEQALVNLSALLYRMCRLGALRYEGHRNERTYYAADETKVPKRHASQPKVPAKPKKVANETAKAKAKARRERLLAEGLCIWCGKTRDLEGRNRCESCIVKGRESRWLYVTSPRGKKRVARNLRRKYKRKAKQRCEDKREVYAFYKAQGLCVSCHSADATRGANCEPCAQKRREVSKQRMRRLYKDRAAVGLCVRCGRDANGKTTCSECSSKTSISRKQRMEKKA